MQRTTYQAYKKGFTLIELLIVVTIIGLLASVILVGLQGFRSAGRDARRVADIRQVQAGLELYFNKCRYYPGLPQPASPCGPPVRLDPSDPATNWRLLEEALVGSDLKINAISREPLLNIPERNYRYITAPDNQSYVLRAELEDRNHPGLVGDIDETAFGELDCADDPPHSSYCVGL